MFTIIIKKMIKNKWMFLCLLAGFILVVAMVSTIPVYIDAVLQRMLTKDLENYQLESGNYPGGYYIDINMFYRYGENVRGRYFRTLDDKLDTEFIRQYKVPLLSTAKVVTLDNLAARPVVQKEENPKNKYISLQAVSGLKDHVSITNGRLFSDKAGDGVYEAIVTEQAMRNLNLLLDETYDVSRIIDTEDAHFKVKIVGVFTIKDLQDVYWFQGLYAYDKGMLIDYDLCLKDFVELERSYLTDVKWYYAFDYHKIFLDNISNMLSTHETQQRWYDKNFRSLGFRMPAMTILEKYFEREKVLKTTLWILLVPVLIMLSFYIFMVSKLIVNYEENEIAVLKSRGASRLQIFSGYLFEGFIICGIAIVLGPPFGLLLCTLLGASNGFLEFVQRTALPLSLNWKAYIYSLTALMFFIATMLIPVFFATRTTIVRFKQKKSRSSDVPIWKKYFIDILVLCASGYGLYRYKSQQKLLSITGVKGSEIGIDPLLFLIMTFFVIGTGLVFLRIFPYLVRLVFQLGKKIWTPVLYASLVQVGRSGGQEQFLMLFIIMAVSFGIFNANAARTLNRNMEERIRYETGADITIQAHWDDNKVDAAILGDLGISGDSYGLSSNDDPVRYIEPDFEPYRDLSGAETVTKVFAKNSGMAQIGDAYVNNVRIMGIIPDEFGRTAWFRPDLLPYHWYQYLNLMTEAPKAVLVSSSFKDKYKAREGDTISIKWGKQDYLECTIYAFIDYWPSFNPNMQNGGKEQPCLVVANLSYLQNKLAIEPYQVWVKRGPGVTDAQIYKDIEDRKLDIDSIESANQQIIKIKNDPLLQGINGSMTLGFIVTMAISAIGFLIYWILSIKSRTLQFGIFRAMGLSLKKVLGMIACEQVLISGVSIISGIILGGVASSLFVPMLQLVYSSAEQVPPFKVIASGSDYMKIYAVVAVMLAAGLIVLGRIISRIKIDQAVKLGED